MCPKPSPTRRRFVRTVSMIGVASLAGCAGSGDGADTEGGSTETDTPTATPTPTPTPRPERVLVGPDAQNVFEPDSLEITAGTTVTFVWRSSGHSLVVDSQPENAAWEGVSETRSSGYEHSHTFDVPGTYEFYCEPHRTFGMEGTITVTEG